MGILQTILDHQSKFDNEVIDNNNLKRKDGSSDLSINYDEIRYQLILQSFTKMRLLMKLMKKTGYKWWKGAQQKLTKEDIQAMLEAETSGDSYNPQARLSNISLRGIAIIDETMEVVEAFEDRESKERLHDEFADLVHFVVSLGLELGINSEDQIKSLYEKKLKVNYDRQEKQKLQ